MRGPEACANVRYKERPLSATILDGKKLATEIEAELAVQVADFVENNGREPCLAAVLVGDDAASGVYVKNKRLACERVGMESQLHRLPAAASESELLELIARLNNDEAVNGILVQLPLPPQIREQKVLDAVHPLKDVDCFHPENVGLMVQGRPRYLPCTPHGCVQILHRYGLKAAGQHVVVVGRSEIVGKPVATMLAQKDSHLGPAACNATVTICHSRTNSLPEICRQADILIAAIGKPRFVQGDWIKPGAVVIDVGINRTESGLCGDVDFEAAKKVASAITPVPRGVGPMTITMLLLNTLAAARAQLA
jgi:methylenetetrahydrofolate dehydrogenase (NADP+) / methenyltetrahydrofolate cyclohydrolase